MPFDAEHEALVLETGTSLNPMDISALGWVIVKQYQTYSNQAQQRPLFLFESVNMSVCEVIHWLLTTDALCVLRMMRIFNRLHKAISLLEYFSSQDWEWNSENMSMLMSELTPEDRKVKKSDFCVYKLWSYNADMISWNCEKRPCFNICTLIITEI